MFHYDYATENTRVSHWARSSTQPPSPPKPREKSPLVHQSTPKVIAAAGSYPAAAMIICILFVTAGFQPGKRELLSLH